MEADVESAYLEIDTTQAVETIITLGAQSEFSTPAYLTFEVVVCGSEELSPSEEILLFVKQVDDSLQIPLSPLLEVTGYEHADCGALTYTSSLGLNSEEAIFDASSPSSLSEHCIEASTIGQVKAQFCFDVEVCGNELVPDLPTETKVYELLEETDILDFQF